MSRYRGPITKLSRRLGIILFEGGQSKAKAFNKKNYKPGEHGQKRFGQFSEYHKHLRAKQAARVLFGITEKQSRKYYDMATKSDEITGIKYLKLLEQRLDNTIYKAGFALTRPQARQMVSHGLIKLNGRRVTVSSIQIKVGDKFEIREKSKVSKLFEPIQKSKVKIPKWLKVDMKNLQGEVVALPDKDDIETIIDYQMITEFYSK